jgi:hypothetical protein
MTMAKRWLHGAGLLLIGAVAGVAHAQPATQTVIFHTPAGLDPGGVVLGAEGAIELLPGARVFRDNGEPGVLSNLGSNGVRLHPLALAGLVRSSSLVTLLPQAHLIGGIGAPAVSIAPGAVVDGVVDTTPVLTPIQRWSFPVTFPPAPPGDVIVQPGASIDLAPGRFRSIVVQPNATLVAHSGAYFLDRLTLFPGARVELRQTGGPTRLFVVAAPQLSATWTFNPAYHGLALVQTGAGSLRVASPFRGVILAASAHLDLVDHGGTHRGSFFARSIRVGAGVSVVYEPANPIVDLITPPDGDLQRCAEMIRPRDDLSGVAREIAYQADIARYCSMAGTDDCTAELAARVNVESFLAAGRLIGEAITPAQYLALMRNLTHKRGSWESGAAIAFALCAGLDGDRDWVPDADDHCPGTPDMTPTDPHGCTDPTLPPAPSVADVRLAFQTKGFLFNQACIHAPVLPKIPAGAFYRPAQLEKGSYIFSGRVMNQPEGCPVWYFFDIEESKPGQPVRTYMVAFADFEAYSSMVGLPAPVPNGFIQFNPLPTDAGSRGLLGSAGGRTIRFRVKAMNGGGFTGGWSEWKITSNDDCTALGFSCK